MSSARSASPILDVRDVSVRFGGVVALDGVSLGLRSGEVCGLIGPNGAGKSTLVDCISGLRSPSSGSIWLDGRDVTDAPPTARSRRGVRRTFQRMQLFGWMSVEDNVLMALEWRGGGGGVAADLVAAPPRRRLERERREQARAALDLCGLSADRDRLAATLPIGSARLLELARAIVDQPRVLLLDEPTSGLDHRSTDLLAGVVARLRAEHATAVVLIEHDMRFVMEHCDRLVVLQLGAVLADGPTAEVRAMESVAAAYLG